LPPTFKAEARFRVKTKAPPEATNSEQFLPHISEVAVYIFFPDRVIREFVVARLTVCGFLFFRDRGIREFVVARLTVCRILVLTHNFLIRKQVITRLPIKMFVGCGYLDDK